MPTLDSVLREVIDRPDDDAPRLLYADLVEKEGNHDRAEFIRVQCELASASSSEPTRLDLKTRERELLEEHGWEWADEFGTRIHEWSYQRGFIERVDANLGLPAEETLSLFGKAPIRHVRDDSQIDDIGPFLQALPDLPPLTGLEFWGFYKVRDSAIAEFLRSPCLGSLKTLVLHHDRNGHMFGDRALVGGIKSPYLSNVEELAVGVDGAWRGPSVRVLRAIATSPHLRRLRRLDMSNAGDQGNRPMMNVETARLTAQSPNFSGLEELDLGQTSFTIDVWDEVLKWPWLAHLKWLRLAGARVIHPDDSHTLAELADLPAYRDGFERLATVDWDTAFISPWHGNASWRGLNWREPTQRLLFAMDRFTRIGDYDGLEGEYRSLCRRLAGEEVAKEIDELPFDQYEDTLRAGLQVAAASLTRNGGRCIFFRLGLGQGWSGSFDVQTNDAAIDEPVSEGSYQTPIAQFPTAPFEEAARIDARQPLYSGTRPSGATLFLLARTVAAFGRCVKESSLPVPVCFSCFYVAFRMWDPERHGA